MLFRGASLVRQSKQQRRSQEVLPRESKTHQVFFYPRLKHDSFDLCKISQHSSDQLRL